LLNNQLISYNLPAQHLALTNRNKEIVGLEATSTNHQKKNMLRTEKQSLILLSFFSHHQEL